MDFDKIWKLNIKIICEKKKTKKFPSLSITIINNNNARNHSVYVFPLIELKSSRARHRYESLPNVLVAKFDFVYFRTNVTFSTAMRILLFFQNLYAFIKEIQIVFSYLKYYYPIR